MPFSVPTKNALLAKCSGCCANPLCKISLTNEHWQLIAQACHIEGEKNDSARYNVNQNDIERNSYKNGIILCPNCHTNIDKDEKTYTVELLRKWKEDDENAPKLNEWFQTRKFLHYTLNNLPIRPKLLLGEKSLFIGRESEIMDILKKINDDIKIISIIGEGGIGKTAISFKILRSCENLFNLMIPIYIEPNITFQEFLEKIIKEIAIFQEGTITFNEAYMQNLLYELFINAGKVILFIDNYENLSDPENQNSSNNNIKIHNFLESLPQNVSILLTSRNRVNLEGEESIELGGLLSQDGANLFLKLSNRYIRKEISNEFRQKIEEVSKIVCGHPLAIKLLSGSYKGGGISKISEMIKEIVTIENRREPNARFVSINACFDYSFKRLNTNLKNILKELILFKSNFMPSAAYQIFGREETLLIELYDRTFLQRYDLSENEISSLYFYNFHTLIKQYLLNIFNPVEFNSNQSDRYINYYIDLLKEIYEKFNQELSSKYRKIIEILTRMEGNDIIHVISLIQNKSFKSNISNLVGLLLLQIGQKLRALRYHTICLDIDLSTEEYDRIANDLDNIGSCINNQYYSEQSLEYRIKAANIFKEKNDKKNEAKQYHNIVISLMKKEDYENAENYAVEGLKIYRINGDDEELADSISNLATIFLVKKKFPESLNLLDEALILYKKIKDWNMVSSIYSNMGIIYNNQQLPDKTIECCEYAINIDSKKNNHSELIRDYRILIDAYSIKNDSEKISLYTEKINKEIEIIEKETNLPYSENLFLNHVGK